MTDITIFVAFTAGLFSFLSPCVLPLIPSYLSFISGVSLEEVRAAQVGWNSLAFILGFSLVFVSLGASASFLASFFLSYRRLIRVLGGILGGFEDSKKDNGGTVTTLKLEEKIWKLYFG